MVQERITDPQSISRHDVEDILARGYTATVQFSRPCYTPELLDSINRLCGEFGAQIEVRFYGHYRSGFDAAVLNHLPEVRWLSVDCLIQIANEETLWRLPCLERLSFGVQDFDRADFLEGFALEGIDGLILSENRKRNFDLAPLARCKELADLIVVGHTRNIEALSGLPKLARLSLNRIPRRQDLAFASGIAPLRTLHILLGGRPSVDELRHAELEQLHIDRVRGFESLGDLSRFPSLHKLRIEDQLQLRSFSLAGVSLRELLVVNCKNLTEIIGLDGQEEMFHFRASRTALDLEHLAQLDWPPAMKVLALYSQSKRRDEALRQQIDRRGYQEFGELRRS